MCASLIKNTYNEMPSWLGLCLINDGDLR